MVESAQQAVKKRTRVPRPYPQHGLEEVLGIARSIQEKNAGLPFDRVRLAKSMGTTPSSSAFMMKLNSSAKYGLTEGGYSDPRISLTPLGTRAAETNREALIEAGMRPDMFKAFYELLDGKRIPGLKEASGVIVDDIGVPEHLASEFLAIVVGNGELVGIVTEVGNSHYVSLADVSGEGARVPDTPPAKQGVAVREPAEGQARDKRARADGLGPVAHRPAGGGRVLVVHSGAGGVVERIVRMLESLGISHGVVETDAIDSSPLSSEWYEQMEECSGTIVVMAGPSRVTSTPGVVSSRASKMLLQLGAALDRFGGQVVMVLGAESDHFLQTVRIQRVYAESDDSGRFEFDLLQGLVSAEIAVISIPGRS